MIEYISGSIAELTPTYVIVDNHGIGYEMNISLTTFSELENKKDVRLLAHEVIREDAHVLFGFSTARERALFRLLIGVSGVGANTARMLLSSASPAELEMVITSGDVKRLKAVKGVGAKTAERVIVDLRDKIKPAGDTLVLEQTPASEAFDEALAALTMLGFAKPQSQKVLTKLFADDPSLKVEKAIKKALTML
jgi:holliday junction DNA helicase ruvA